MKNITIMMKSVTIFLMLISAFRTVAQVGYPSERATNVIPPSPAAAALLSFGNIPVNMFTGSPNIAIPIYTIETGKLKIPLTLSYSANGVKVEEIASSYGMGWSLSLGGVINKTIRSVNDEIAPGYPTGSGTLVSQYMNNQLTHTQKQSFSLGITQGGYDGEPDLFSYSFGDYHGSFVFTPTNQALQIEGEPLQITPVYNGSSNIYEFVIVDPYGVKYYFNDREMTETVATFKVNGTTAPMDPQNYISAWYLSKIVSPTGEEITFQYNTVSVSPSYLGAFSVYHLKSVNPLQDCNGNATAETTLYTSTTNSTTIAQKKIEKVVFPAGEIAINYQSQQRTDLAGDKAIQSISIKNKGGQVLNTFTFSHTYFSNRLFLTQLVDASAVRPYQFFYDQPQNLPTRISKAQDYWGFYNGKTSNNTLLPKINGASLNGVRYLNYQEGADREPDFDFMKKGILDKIIYPSGGETRFVYESHQYGNLTGTIDVLDTIRTVSNQNVSVIADPSGWKETTFVLDHAQEISISANVKGANTKTELRDLSGTLYFSHYSNGSNQMQTVQKDVFLEAGSYKLRAFNWESDFFASMVAGYAVQTNMDIYKFKNGGGLRVKEVADFSDSQTLVSKRTYEYTLHADPDRSSGILITNYIYDYLQTKSGYVGECGIGFIYDAVYHVRLTGSAVPMASSAGSHVEYSEVTERYEDGGGKGKTVTFYTSSKESGNRDINSYTFPYMASFSKGYNRGKVKRLESYKLVSGNYSLIREVQNEYQSLPALDIIHGISIGLVGEYPAIPQNNVYNHNSYSFARDYYAQISSIERSYDGSMAEKKVEFYYDNTIHCKPTRIELTNSDGSNEVTYTAYPSDYANTTGFIGEMKSNYLIAYPIEQVRYREVGSTRTVLSGSITTYKTGGKGLMDQVLALETASPVPLASFKFSNRSMGQLPPSVGSPGNYSADTRYKPRLTYNSYDTKGNPLQVTPADGISTCYVWGYGQQYPVAEVRNATNAEVTATGINLSVLNSLTSTDAQRNVELAKIRNHATMKKAQITTYAYKPLYGMLSATDASERTVWYDYDNFGRLWRIRDHHGNVIEEYKYNYRP